jgi:hypothetical protein
MSTGLLESSLTLSVVDYIVIKAIDIRFREPLKIYAGRQRKRDVQAIVPSLFLYAAPLLHMPYYQNITYLEPRSDQETTAYQANAAAATALGFYRLVSK